MSMIESYREKRNIFEKKGIFWVFLKKFLNFVGITKNIIGFLYKSAKKDKKKPRVNQWFAPRFLLFNHFLSAFLSITIFASLNIDACSERGLKPAFCIFEITSYVL